MSDYDNHNKCYFLCPELRFSLCFNILLVILAMCISPFIILVYVIGYSVIYAIYIACDLAGKYHRCNAGWLWCLFGVFVMFPLGLAIGAALAGLAIVFGTIPAIYYGFAFIARVCYNTCKN